MSTNSVATLMAVQLPRAYEVELLQRDLQTLRDVRRAPQPGPYHKGDWTGIALHSMAAGNRYFPAHPEQNTTRRLKSFSALPISNMFSTI